MKNNEEEGMSLKDNLENVLYTRAYEKIEKQAEGNRESFSDRQEEIEEALRVKKFHAKGGATKHMKAKNQAEKTKLTGKSKAKLRQQGIKLKKSLRKQTGAKKRIKVAKQAKAMKRRGG